MNIIIPLGGIGERFKNNGYTTPKPLINIFGKPMIFYLLDNLHLKKEDNLIIIYNKELNNYSFDNIIKQKYNNINIIELNKQTEGAAETILIGLSNITNEMLKNKCVLVDGDTFYNVDILSQYRKEENNAIVCFKDVQDKPIYSYIEIDEKQNIKDIKEKCKISEYANTGCYCFKNGNILKQYCQKIIDSNIREKNEFYTSCVIKEMLKDDHIFKAIVIQYNDFTCVGTPMQLKIFCSNLSNNNDKKRICFELDNTLINISPQDIICPIYKNIEYLQFLKKLGHTIIICTSRNMDIYNGNVGLIVKNICKTVIDTLKIFEIPYDELHFGKPFADFYIDNKAINAYDDLEKKIGIYKTNIQERDFNEIISDKMDIIIKKSKTNKLKGEIYYYLHIPIEIKKYFPIFIDYGTDFYSIEKINGITLSYLYVNESLSEEILTRYLGLMHEIHMLQRDNSPEDINIYHNYSNKIKNRYDSYNYSQYPNSEGIYKILIDYFREYEKEKRGIFGIIHGDSVFSNCLLDNNNNFKLIDMNGTLNDTYTIYGDILYDYSKIYQSLIGYDEILLNKILSNDYKRNLINVFKSFIVSKFGELYIEYIKMITNSLLFSLIPLHNNNKCVDFFKLIDL
jgi:capsule biosynthesis phosphatase